ncbi:MAG: signal peptidase II [Syntrophomonas sp.]
MRFWIYFILVLVLDRASKWWISHNFFHGQSTPLLDGLLYLTYVQNRGAAFGIMQGKSYFFLLCGATVVIALILYNIMYRVPSPAALITGLIAGGALGNLIDRFFYGYVIDFLDLGWWPVFNIADMGIVCGGILLTMYIIFLEKSEARHGKY